MDKYTQADRFLKIDTPFDDDFFLLNALTAREGISELFQIDAELLHEESVAWPKCDEVDAKKILGQNVRIEMNLPGRGHRFFNGIVSRISQGYRDRRTTHYSITIVPEIWKYTQRTQSRIFQQKTVQSIIEAVLFDLSNPVKFDLRSEYKPRNYCVQYRETDFDFMSRLLEEEGIYYFFRHNEDGAHELVISDAPTFSNDCPDLFELDYFEENTGNIYEAYISEWRTDYRIGPGQIAFRDHHIQQPGKRLEKTTPTKFVVGDNASWEVYDYPGGYARKFDGISAQGTDKGSDLNNIDPDGQRTAENAMQVIDAQYMVGTGTSNCCSFTSGHRMKMKQYPHTAVNGQYVLTSVLHRAIQAPAYQADESSGDEEKTYENSFTALSHGRPEAVPFRPVRKTAKPIVHGSQTAVVVGAGSEEIYTDKYGRVKVQFHWDRDGQADGLDSCWLPVAQTWAGNGWGSFFIPRVGMEVIVHFLEGNPDSPIVDGCVYNPKNMHPYALPEHKTMSGVKTDSSTGGGGFNEFRFEDKKGSEHVFLHAQKNQHIRVKSTRREYIGGDRHLTVGRDKREKIGRDKHVLIEGEKREKIAKDFDLTIDGAVHSYVKGEVNSDVNGDYTEAVGGNYAIDAGSFYVKASKTLVLEATSGITLKVGGNFITLNSAGIFIQGTMVMINSGGAPLPGIPGPQNVIIEPDEAELPINANPGDKMETYKQQRRKSPPKPDKPSFKPKKDKEAHWIEIQLNDQDGNPVPYERYQIEMPDGTVTRGSLNGKGFARIDGIDPAGNCKVTFLKLDKTLWKKA